MRREAPVGGGAGRRPGAVAGRYTASPDGAGARLRVLLLIKGLGAGGAERLVSLSARLGDAVTFAYEVAYVLPWKTDLVGELERVGVPVHCLDGGAAWNLRWAARLRQLLLDRRYDIVHVHSPYVAGFARVVARSLPRRVRPAVLYTEHLPWSGYRGLTRLLNAATFPLDDAQIAVSEAVRRSIPAALRKPVEVVLHGIPLDAARSARARDDVRRELGVGEGEVVVGTVAHYRAQKAYPDLLEAARLVLDRGVPTRFVAVGDGPLEEEIRARHRALGLGDRFLLLGRREDAHRVLSGFDVFVLPSLFEGMPIAVVEALALGLPVVATEVAGTTEAVTHGREALLTPPSRPDLLADAIAALAWDPERRARMGRAALQRSAEFDVGRAVARVEGIYRDAVARRGGALPGVDAGRVAGSEGGSGPC